MANYNTFCLSDTKTRKVRLITSSARKCKAAFSKGHKIEVWNANNCIEVIYSRNIEDFEKYITIEKQYISEKQRKAEARNRKRRSRLAS